MLGSSLWRALFKNQGKYPSRLLKSGAAAMIIMTMGFILWPATPAKLELANPQSRDALSLMEHWQQGELVVLIRHAERCDRSSNPCLGPADGITRLGSSESHQLGLQYLGLGLGNTDVLSSPITRTAQTAQYMFDKETVTEQWLADCGPTMRNEVVAHKHAQRNLILVTHSGCISDFEKQSGYKHAGASEYNSSLFVWITANGVLKVVGIANMEDWPKLARQSTSGRQN